MFKPVLITLNDFAPDDYTRRMFLSEPKEYIIPEWARLLAAEEIQHDITGCKAAVMAKYGLYTVTEIFGPYIK